MAVNNDYDRDVTFEIIDHLGVLATYPTGWRKELNLVSWNDREPKYDIRDWAPEHAKMGKGVTLSADEAVELKNLLAGIDFDSFE